MDLSVDAHLFRIPGDGMRPEDQEPGGKSSVERVEQVANLRGLPEKGPLQVRQADIGDVDKMQHLCDVIICSFEQHLGIAHGCHLQEELGVPPASCSIVSRQIMHSIRLHRPSVKCYPMSEGQVASNSISNRRSSLQISLDAARTGRSGWHGISGTWGGNLHPDHS